MPMAITPRIVNDVDGSVWKDHEVETFWLKEFLETYLPSYIIIEMSMRSPTVTFKVHPEWQRLAGIDGDEVN